MPDFDVQQVREAAARAMDPGCIKIDGPRLADTQAIAAMSVIVPAVTEQIRALHKTVPHEGAPGWFWCHGCRHSVSADAKVCATVRLLDELDAAARGEQP